MKKIIAMLIVALLLLSVTLVLTTPKAEAATGHSHCICGGTVPAMEGTAKTQAQSAHGSCASKTWTAFTTAGCLTTGKISTSDYAFRSSGNYYLTADVTLTKPMEALKGQTVNLCLNGHTLTTNGRMINLYGGTLNICDCSAAKTGKLACGPTAGALAYLYAYGNLSLYGLTATTSQAGTVLWGGLVAVGNDGYTYSGTTYAKTNNTVFNAYGCVLDGSKVTTGKGGTIWCFGGQAVNLYGTEVIGGRAVAEDTTTARAGTILMEAGSLKAVGCKIHGGYARPYGGNIYASGSATTVTLTETDVYDGTVETIFKTGTTTVSTRGYGANIYLNGIAASTFTGSKLYGGSGDTKTFGGSLYINDANLTMTNCTLTGGDTYIDEGGLIYESSTGTLTLNNCQMSGGKSNSGGIIHLHGTLTANDCVFENGRVKNKGGNITAFRPCNATFNRCTVRYGEACSDNLYDGSGGNVYIGCNADQTGTFATAKFYDSVIEDGFTYGNGGNVYALNGADVLFDNTDITGGVSTRSGGNVFVSYGTYTVQSPTTTTKYTREYGDNTRYDDETSPEYHTSAIYSGSSVIEYKMSRPALKLKNMTVTEGVAGATCGNCYVYAGDITMSGNIQINDLYGKNARNLRVYTDRMSTIDISNLDAESNIGIYQNASSQKDDSGNPIVVLPIFNNATYAQKACFWYESGSQQLTCEQATKGMEIYARSKSEHWHCICGGVSTDPNHQHVDVKFTEWKGTSFTEGGHYYLDTNRTPSGTYNAYSFSNNTYDFCLNGHTLRNNKADGSTVFKVNSTASVNICDCGDGALQASGNTARNGGIIENLGTLTIFNAVLERVDTDTRTAVPNGGVISNSGTLVLDGATLKNGYAVNGGTLYNTGTATLRGNTVLTGGYATTTGGNISLAGNSAKLYVTGNTKILEGYCAKGNSADGIEINGGTLDLSGNVTITNKDPMDIYLKQAGLITIHDLTTEDTIGVGTSNTDEPFATSDGAYSDVFYAKVINGAPLFDGTNLYLQKEAVAAVFAGNTLVNQYPTVQGAVDALAAGQFVRMLDDTTEDITVSKTVYLDLCGKTLGGTVTISGGKLYGADTTTNGFVGTGCGKLTATVTGGKVAAYVNAPAGMFANGIVRYAAVPGSDGYTFHRFYIDIVASTLRPNSVSVGCKAIIMGDDAVKNYLNETDAIGFELWTVDGNGKQSMPASISLSRAYFTAGTEGNALFVQVDNMMEEGNDALNAATVQTTVHAQAYICLGEEKVTSRDFAFTLQQQLEQANAYCASGSDVFTEQQKSNLNYVCKRFASYMQGWSLANILAYGA